MTSVRRSKPCILPTLMQGWRSGESTCLPPMWPGFDIHTRRQMWIEFVGSLLWYERFFSGYSGFPLSPTFDLQKTIVNSDLSYVDLISPRIVNCHLKTPCGELSIRSIVILILKTILDEVLAIQNNHGQGKCYQPQPLASADNTSETLIIPDITKTQSKNYWTLL